MTTVCENHAICPECNAYLDLDQMSDETRDEGVHTAICYSCGHQFAFKVEMVLMVHSPGPEDGRASIRDSFDKKAESREGSIDAKGCTGA